MRRFIMSVVAVGLLLYAAAPVAAQARSGYTPGRSGFGQAFVRGAGIGLGLSVGSRLGSVYGGYPALFAPRFSHGFSTSRSFGFSAFSTGSFALSQSRLVLPRSRLVLVEEFVEEPVTEVIREWVIIRGR